MPISETFKKIRNALHLPLKIAVTSLLGTDQCYELKCKIGSNLYSIVQLSTDDIDRILLHVEICDKKSGKGTPHNVPLLFYDLKFGIPRPRYVGRTHIVKESKYFVVVPCRECDHGIVTTRNDIEISLQAVKDMIKVGIDKDSGSNDEENPHAQKPLVLAVARFADISGRKFRRISIPEYLRSIAEAFEKQNPTDENLCTLLMTEIDMKQCGLYNIAITSRKKSFGGRSRRTPKITDWQYVSCDFKWGVLRRHVDQFQSIDPLLCDLMITTSDYFFQRRNEKITNWSLWFDLNLKANSDRMVSNLRSVDPARLKDAINATFNAGIKDLFRNELIREATKYALSLSLKGVRSDHPRKVVGQNWVFDILYRGDGHLKTFTKTVKSVSEEGYRMKMISVWIWLFLFVGGIIPVTYIGIRIWTTDSNITLEDLFNTAIAIIALYIAIVPGLLFQSYYSGEKLTDVLSNIRNIDSQEEFDARDEDCQHIDILQVIRLSKNQPQFMGGEMMRYLLSPKVDLGTTGECLFNAGAPIRFSNLEQAGFAIYEDKEGNLFMIDRWRNFFEVFIGVEVSDKSDSTHSGQNLSTEASVSATEEETNQYQLEKAHKKPEDEKNEEEHLELYCVPKTTNAELEFNDGEGKISFQYSAGHGVRPSSHEGVISRLLPYGSRKRIVRRYDERMAVVKSRRFISNKLILNMKIGRDIGDGILDGADDM